MAPLKAILEYSRESAPYIGKTELFWNDTHISGRMLEFHLDPENDAASRRPISIDRTVAWLKVNAFALITQESPLRILDLGCGPGLYASRLARAGYTVTGVDLSPRSIEYARERAASERLEIDYRVMDYRNLPFHDSFDAAMMIYCDLGALSPEDRTLILSKIHGVLAPGGVFAFDVASEGFAAGETNSRSWSAHEEGFWSPRPYLLLEEKKVFPGEKMILREHYVIDLADGEVKRYPLRDHWFDEKDIRSMLEASGFKLEGLQQNVTGHDENVLFAVAIKTKIK